MLVLTRKQGEAILIKKSGTEDIIVVSLINIQGNQVKLGIQADLSFLIVREEILEKWVNF